MRKGNKWSKYDRNRHYLSEIDLHHLTVIGNLTSQETRILKHTHYVFRGFSLVLYQILFQNVLLGGVVWGGGTLLLHPKQKRVVFLIRLKGVENIGGLIYKAIDPVGLYFIVRIVCCLAHGLTINFLLYSKIKDPYKFVNGG